MNLRVPIKGMIDCFENVVAHRRFHIMSKVESRRSSFLTFDLTPLTFDLRLLLVYPPLVGAIQNIGQARQFFLHIGTDANERRNPCRVFNVITAGTKMKMIEIPLE